MLRPGWEHLFASKKYAWIMLGRKSEILQGYSALSDEVLMITDCLTDQIFRAFVDSNNSNKNVYIRFAKCNMMRPDHESKS
jgi:hypothetical protein